MRIHSIPGVLLSIRCRGTSQKFIRFQYTLFILNISCYYTLRVVFEMDWHWNFSLRARQNTLCNTWSLFFMFFNLCTFINRPPDRFIEHHAFWWTKVTFLPERHLSVFHSRLGQAPHFRVFLHVNLFGIDANYNLNTGLFVSSRNASTTQLVPHRTPELGIRQEK